MKQNYKGLIFTNHALERMQQRGVRQKDAWATWRKPDTKHFSKNQNVWVYFKDLNTRKIKIVAKQNEKKQWIALSVWATFKSADKSSNFQKLFNFVLNKLGST